MRFIVLIWGIAVVGISAALKESDLCTINDQHGICLLRSDCSEYAQLQQLGIRPKICAYGPNHQPIICCPTLKLQLKLRKSEQYCEQYRKLASKEIFYGPLSLDKGAVRREFVPQCDDTLGLIVGGVVSAPGEFPHMAVLGWIENKGEPKFHCGGSLISDRYVLTAGHCIVSFKKPPSLVRLGDYNLYSKLDHLNEVDFGIEKTIRHPNYSPSISKYNDIALIRLNRTVEFGLTIRPACLWPSMELNVSSAIAIGYGATEDATNSDGLLKVKLDILEYDSCSFLYMNERKLPDSIVESQLCANTPVGGKDTCQGDSGGPLQIALKEHKCLYYVIGITSFGYYCGGINTAGVYSKVSFYLDWIESQVWP